MIVVKIIGCNKIILSFPFSDTGIGTVPCHREFIMILMHTARYPVCPGTVKIHLFRIPVHSLLHTGSVTIFCSGFYLFQIFRRRCTHSFRHLIGNILGNQEPAFQPFRHSFLHRKKIPRQPSFRTVLLIGKTAVPDIRFTCRQRAALCFSQFLIGQVRNPA